MLSQRDIMKTGIAIGTIVLLVGCTSNEHLQPYTLDITSKTPNSCLGWQSVQLKPRTAEILQQSDPDLAASIQTHNLKGKNMRCWE